MTAKDIVGFADRQGFKLERGGCAKLNDPLDHCACPRRTLANEVTKTESMYNPRVIYLVQEKFGLTAFDQECLETGFEGWNDKFTTNECKANEYYKLGKKIFKLVSQHE